MMINILINSNKTLKPEVEVKAAGSDKVNIFVEAPTLPEANKLIVPGERMALKAMKEWLPQDPEEQPQAQQHYKFIPLSIEDMENTINTFEASDKGIRFLHSMDLAKTLTKKKDKTGGLSLSELNYMRASAYSDVWKAMFNIYNIAFRRGYNAGKEDGKK